MSSPASLARHHLYLAVEAPFPARTTIGVAGLPLDARVEIELIAKREG